MRGFFGRVPGFRRGQLAQLVEQRIENPRVLGSIPRLATKYSTASHSGGRFSFLPHRSQIVASQHGIQPRSGDCKDARNLARICVSFELSSDASAVLKLKPLMPVP